MEDEIEKLVKKAVEYECQLIDCLCCKFVRESGYDVKDIIMVRREVGLGHTEYFFKHKNTTYKNLTNNTHG